MVRLSAASLCKKLEHMNGKSIELDVLRDESHNVPNTCHGKTVFELVQHGQAD